MSLSGQLLRPTGIGPLCFSFSAVSVENAEYLTPAHSSKITGSSHTRDHIVPNTVD